jgi:hypothetical protein
MNVPTEKLVEIIGRQAIEITLLAEQNRDLVMRLRAQSVDQEAPEEPEGS